MSLDQEPRRSRRSILAAAAGGAAGLAASRLAAPGLVSAANPPLLLNQDNPAAGLTTLTGNGINMLKVVTGTQATAIWAVSGSGAAVVAQTDSGVGLSAQATSGIAVNGTSGAGTALDGASTTGTGVRGWSSSGSGVQGFSGVTGTPPSALKTGVYGYAAQDTAAIGVKGQSTVGRGLQGEATSGMGVRAAATTGNGILATATTGTAANFATSGLKSGLALRTVGRVRFDNSVGIATITAGTSSVTVTPGIDLTATSAVVATLQGSAGGALVERVSVNATTDRFTIYLSKNTTVAVKVAWHVFG